MGYLRRVRGIANSQGRRDVRDLPIQDEFTRRQVETGSFLVCRRLDCGTYIGIAPLMFTKALCVGITETEMFEKRYCFDNAAACYHAFATMVDPSQVPRGWIARRPETPDDIRAKARPGYKPQPYEPDDDG